ncbi:SprB repeat-containing protein [Dyadobacter sp. 32]|uniref:SprB repeat-containing protein n=1 Tax=Dyadobacter sp. 32 TaxID=538966 RepID=UPI0011F09A29
MKKRYYSFLLKGGLCLLVLLLSQAALAQNKLFMNPIKYTDRFLSVYQSSCITASTIHLFVNNVEIYSSKTFFITSDYWSFEIEYGLMKPGDVFKVTDDCGSIPFQQVVKDDYVYVEAPPGTGHPGNGIGPNDQTPPYSKLSTPVAIGKCAPVNIDSHGLVNYYIFSPETNGTFSINGAPLTNGPTGINPGGYDINFNGFPGTPAYTINPNGSITSNTPLKLESNTHFSGQIPIVLEYQHGGINPGNDLSFGFKAMAFRNIGNGGADVDKAALGGVINKIPKTATPLSKYKITYDGVYYRAYIDNVLVEELRRFVEYSASSGVLTPGSAAGLDYSTPVSWTGMSSGDQWVSVLVDGVLYTRQLFKVAADLVVNPVPTPVACSSGNTGKITVNVTGGLAPLQYALGTGAYAASNVFSGLAAGTYSVKVRDASGCVATGTATIGASSALSVSIASKTDETCATASNASVKLLAAGGTGPYTYSVDGVAFQNSNEFTGLASGPYVFSVKDDNDCLGTVKDTIRTSSKLIIGVLSKQNVTCFSGNNGAVSISTAGSVVSGTLQFSVDNGVTYQASSTFTGLTAGTYKVVVKDNVCSASTNVTISQPTELTISAVQKGISCNALSDGSIEALGSGGTGPYQYSINGTLYGTSNVFAGLAAGNYKIWVKDASGCVKESAIVALTQPATVALTVFSKTDVSCYGASTGSLTLSGTGGTFPYGFSKDGTTFQTSSTFSSLPAGALTLTLKDANGCKATVSGEILQGADIIVTASNSGTVSCYGGNNGQVTATASGGTGQLKYAIDGTNFITASTFTSLTAGSYQVTVSDINGCKKVSAPVIVAQATQIIPLITKSEVKCFSGNDGTVTVSASGGTGAYSYSKDAVNFQATGAFAGLVAGDYVFSVKDANSCVRTINASITQPTDLIVSSTAGSQVLCYNGNSGIVQASSAGGTSPYQYSVDGTAYQTAANFGSLVIGTYKIWVKDANGCVKQTNTVTLTQPTDLLISVASQTAVKCYGGNDGSVQLAASGGVSPYVYSKDSLSYQPSAGFSGLGATAFRFLVKDANGCSKGVTAQVTQPGQPYKISLASQTSLTCNSENIGRIEVKNAGGTAPYQVSLDNTTFQGSEVFSGLAAGTYTIHGKDANNCTFTMPVVTLTQPTGIVVTLLSKKDVDCEYYTKGEALVGAQGSNGNFSYTLAGSDFKFNTISPVTNTTGLFENLMAGDYTVTARDQSGCIMDYPVTIIPKSTNIRYDISKTLPSSCTSEDGSISVINASGGRPPYQYSISSQNSFFANSTFSGLLNGTYLVTVADELCSYKKEVDLRLPNSIKADYSIDPVSCATPVANLTVTNITGGNGNYQLSLNGGGFSANRSFANLHPNVYNLVVQDSPLSCKTAIGIEIKEQNRADMQIASRQNVLCYGGNSGSITIKGDNNMGPFTYAINNSAFTADGTFSGLTIGTYRLYVKNRMGCLDSLRTTLVEPTKLTSSFTKKDNDCNGDKTGGLELFGDGGTPAYVFSIDGSSYVSSGKFETLPANNYKAYVKDANGCVSTQDIAVVQPPLLTIVPMYQDTVRCFGESNGMINVVAGGGTPAYQYSINGTDYLPDSKFSNLAAGTYQFYAKDAKGCLKTASISLTQPQLLELAFASKQDPLCYEGKDGNIKVLAKGGNGGNEAVSKVLRRSFRFFTEFD